MLKFAGRTHNAHIFNVSFTTFMQSHAECSIATASRMSICLSIHEIEVGRRIIPQFASLVCSLFADPNNMNLFQREEHPRLAQNFGRNSTNITIED